MDFYAPKKKPEVTHYENKERLPGKWHKEDKKKIGKRKGEARDLVPIQKKLDAILKKLSK
jgi:hypothetical protein